MDETSSRNDMLNGTPHPPPDALGIPGLPTHLDPFPKSLRLCLDAQITDRSPFAVDGGGYSDIWTGSFRGVKVAIKTLRPFSTKGTRIEKAKQLKRLWREYLVSSRLRHPNVVECIGYSYDFTPGFEIPSLISRWMSNGTVDTYIRTHPDVDRLKIVLGIARGLSYLHTQQPAIVHGDLRAGNTLVSDAGVACLTDFGLSKILGDTTGMTTSSELAGSVRWMSPELLHNERLSEKSDVWAYGMTVLEIMSGRRPYDGFNSEVVVFGEIIKERLPERPMHDDVSAALTDNLWAVCQRCWALRPTQRPSMQEVTFELLILSTRMGRDNIVYRDPSPGAPSQSQIGLVGGAQGGGIGQLYDPSYTASPRLFPDYRELKKEGSHWFAVFSEQVPQRGLDVNLVHTLQHDSVVCCVRFSADGKYLATGCNHSAQIYETRTGVKMCVLVDKGAAQDGDLYIRSVCFSPDGKYLATGAEDNLIRIWDIETRRIRSVFEGHQDYIDSLDFSHDGWLLVSGSGDKTARIWHVVTGQYKSLLNIEPADVDCGVMSVAISPDGRLVATGSLDSFVRLWDVHSGALIERLIGHLDSVYSVAFTPDGNGLISGSLDQTLKHWDLGPLLRHPAWTEPLGQPSPKRSRRNERGAKGCQCTVDFKGHTDYVLSAAVSHDSQWVLSGSKDRCVRFWDMHTGQAQLMLEGHKNSVISVDLSPMGGMFATGSGDWSARLWNYTTLQ